ncbi:Gly-Xaa carboxypeptidase [Pichia californica]|uniref:Gly-Xaa carboxypeptidase n=1 Tax=Pichia californica TaxID=460514 RepID=A0A9P6WKR4_9ASCO|nr:Gly-Xaa carboxypeptidase [[Candida] californica]KAG0687808.1 Gly-Xaa carboxypeptidase [[Candida] californica]
MKMKFHKEKYICLEDEESLLNTKNKSSIFTVKKLILLVFAALLFGFLNSSNFGFTNTTTKNSIVRYEKPLCPVPSKVPIKEHDNVQFILTNKDYHEGIINRFSKSIQIPTFVFDENNDYTKMQKFHDFLKESYPLTYETAEIDIVHDYGLVFHFPGLNTDLKPIMLTAHMDTVPIGDPNDWLESPFSGRFDGEKFYGRGASDCKNLLIGLMEAMEKLISDGKSTFERGVVFAFGYDEERSGRDGAFYISKFLLEKFGPNSMESIVDEGPKMFTDFMGDYYSMIINGEKGYTDLKIEINTPGGHSSMPRDHTSIGMMSTFLSEYESNLYDPLLVPENPMMEFFECAAEQGHLPKDIKNAALNARSDTKAKEILLDYGLSDPHIKYNFRTTQAIDIIDGGDKANSLPRDVTTIINHRISYGNSPETILKKATSLGKGTAKRYDIGLTVDDEDIFPETINGKLTISFFDTPLLPAKVSPTNSEFYREFTGLIKSFYEDEVYPEKFTEGKKIIITPGIMTGNTDTKHYWDLTDNIFRVQPGHSENSNAHGPNEWISIESHLQSISFYYNYISHFSVNDE